MKSFDENTSAACAEAAAAIIGEINALKPLPLLDLNLQRASLIIVDAVNGFIREGKMASPLIESVIPPIAELLGEFKRLGASVIAFADCHGENCTEFEAFPPHCVENTSESELVDELKSIGGYKLIKKNSTNGFHESEFAEFLEANPQIDTFVVTGDCTDICVLQFCLSLKTWFTARNQKIRVIIPLNCVETYNAPWHSSDFMNIAAYKIMADSGIEFVKAIKDASINS
ncbi:MAG: cysteine hydrolase [Oscillospiraceae bacterium]|nr:cysteine hydrolase [Oscillospiraceae bacterium]